MQKTVIFRGVALPLALLLPQVAITGIFFFWPAGQAVWSSFLREDAFGLSREFVWFENFTYILADPNVLPVMRNTMVFACLVVALAMAVALFLAVQADKAIRAAAAFRTLLIWPYAVAPAVAAMLWLFLFHPQIGIFGRMLNNAGIAWDYRINGGQAMALVIVAAAWKQVSYNFIFFLVALHGIPRAVLDAASIDGARPIRRFWTIVFPLIWPTTAFLLAVNLVYALCDTFGTIHALTQGGPGISTTTLIYKAYVDGVQHLNFGSSAAQSVILMLLVMVMTAVQFRFLGRQVHH